MSAAIFAAVALVVGAASLFAQSAWVRAGTYVCLVLAMFGLWWASLGVPRPVLFGAPQGTVVAFSFDEPRAIYVWLQAPDARAPVAIALPWHERVAALLQRAEQQAKASGAALKMRGQHEGGGNGVPVRRQVAPMFYPAPAPALAAKQSP